MPLAMNGETAEASAFAEWKTAILKALSDGLYHIEKYMTQAGTTPASGMPRKNRAVRRPAAFLVPAMLITIIPQTINTHGKK